MEISVLFYKLGCVRIPIYFDSRKVEIQVVGLATQDANVDALELKYPMLRGTIRDQVTQQRRPFIRFFACGEDMSLEPSDSPLPDAVVKGTEPFRIVGAMTGKFYRAGWQT